MTDTDSTNCNWNQYDDEYGSYETDCGHGYVINEGSPTENGMKFCPFCGRTLLGHPFEWETDND